jgi:hypothetical protein
LDSASGNISFGTGHTAANTTHLTNLRLVMMRAKQPLRNKAWWLKNTISQYQPSLG